MARRDKGDGSIYQRGDGKWVAQVDISGGLKPRRYLRRLADSKAEAKTILKQVAPHVPALRSDGVTTLGDWLTDWLVRRAPHWRPSTAASYRDMATRIVIPALGHLPLHELTTRHVQRWVDRAIAEGTGRRAVEYARSMLRAACTDAVRHGLLVSGNPASLVQIPPRPQKDAPPVQPAQMQHLLATAEGSWLHPCIVLTVLYGLRRGELLGLADDAIDERVGVLAVTRTIVRVDGSVTVSRPKTARSRRVLPLHPMALDAIAALRARRAKYRKAAKRSWKTGQPAWLVSSDIGTPLEPATLHRAWHTLRKAAGFPTLTWHQLRHAAVAVRKGAGIDTRTIADTVGHVHLSMTDVVYDHGTIERIAAGVTATATALTAVRAVSQSGVKAKKSGAASGRLRSGAARLSA
jgi:integrase